MDVHIMLLIQDMVTLTHQ